MSLGRLVKVLGSDLLAGIVAPDGLDLPVRGVRIHDPADPLHARSGDLVLAVGVGPDHPDLGHLLTAAAAADATAVMMRTHHPDTLPAAAADQAGIALVAVTPDLDWGQLHSLLANIVTITRGPGDHADRQVEAELLTAVLDGHGPIPALADRLDLDLDTPTVIVSFTLHGADQTTIGIQREHARELIATHCQAYRHHHLLTTNGPTCHLLLPTDQVDTARRLATAILDRTATVLTVPIVAGIGTIAATLHQLPASRRDADQAAHTLATRHGDLPRVAHIDDVRVQAILADLADHTARHPHLLTGRLDQLRAQDTKRGTCYLDTIRAYLNHFGDVTAAAHVMDVHPNTFRYRLKRACETAHLNLADPDERLIATLQLRLDHRTGH